MCIIDNFTILSSCGDGILQQDLSEILLENPQSAPVDKTISAYFKESNDVEGAVLIVDKTRQLVLIDPKGHRSYIDEAQSFWAIGCAADLCIGYLKALQKHKGKVEVSDAVDAIKMATQFDSGIDDKCQVYQLKNDEF